MLKVKGMVNIGNIKVNTIGSLCNFSIGQNQLIGHKTAYKRSEGFGEESSDFTQHIHPISIVNDADIVDAYDHMQFKRK